MYISCIYRFRSLSIVSKKKDEIIDKLRAEEKEKMKSQTGGKLELIKFLIPSIYAMI